MGLVETVFYAHAGRTKVQLKRTTKSTTKSTTPSVAHARLRTQHAATSGPYLHYISQLLLVVFNIYFQFPHYIS